MNYATVLKFPKNFLEEKHKEYVQNGYTIFTESELPFSENEWQEIEEEHKKLDYFDVHAPETNEAVANVRCFRIKKSFLPEIYNEKIWALLNKSDLYEICKATTGLNEPFMDRAQAHIYSAGGLLGRHSDYDAYKDMRCTSILLLNDDYEGGEFIIYNNEESPAVLKPKARSLILTNSMIDHSVNETYSGFRKNVCFFFTEGPCAPAGIAA